jgi:hypothetical protein
MHLEIGTTEVQFVAILVCGGRGYWRKSEENGAAPGS